MIGRNDLCWCNSGQKWKKCHYPELPKKSFDDLKKEALQTWKIRLKTTDEIAGIRKSGHLAAEILNRVAEKAKAGVTTEELNTFAMELHKKAGAIPAPLGYGHPPFPKGICTSLNEVICHGIPGPQVLKEGDILNIDVTTILDGFYGDCSRMVVIGKTTPDRALVVDVAYESLMRAIEVVKPGGVISDIGDAIEPYATGRGCSVVHQFVGHGVGLEFHEAPQVPHFQNGSRVPFIPGMIFTIEPMINKGSPDAVIDQKDEWTARTPDSLPSAQWEHTLLVTEDGCEILTPWGGQILTAS